MSRGECGCDSITRDGVRQPEEPLAKIFFDLGDDRILLREVVLVERAARPGELRMVVTRTGLTERAAGKADQTAAANGTLTPTTPRQRSGCSQAKVHATGAPQSCPTTTAFCSP